MTGQSFRAYGSSLWWIWPSLSVPLFTWPTNPHALMAIALGISLDLWNLAKSFTSFVYMASQSRMSRDCPSFLTEYRSLAIPLFTSSSQSACSNGYSLVFLWICETWLSLSLSLFTWSANHESDRVFHTWTEFLSLAIPLFTWPTNPHAAKTYVYVNMCFTEIWPSLSLSLFTWLANQECLIVLYSLDRFSQYLHFFVYIKQPIRMQESIRTISIWNPQVCHFLCLHPWPITCRVFNYTFQECRITFSTY